MFPNPISWGWDRLTGWANGATANITESIFASLAAWILDSAVGLFGLVSVAVFSNEGLADDCTTQTLTVCSRGTFVFDTFARSRAAAAVLLVAFTLWSVGKAALGGDVGAIGRKFFFEVPKAVLMSALILQITIVMLLATDELSQFLMHPALAPDREAYFEQFTQIGQIEGGNGAMASFSIVVLGVLLAFGSVGLWALMMLRGAAVAILVTLAPLVAVASVTSYSTAMQKLLKLMIALIGSKVIIVLCMSLGVSAVMNMPWVRAGLDAEAVIVAPPAPPGEEPPAIDLNPGDDTAEATRVAYTLATGLLVVVASLFSPMLVMQLIPDSLEQYYAFGQAGRLSGRFNQGLRSAGGSAATAGGARAGAAATRAGRAAGGVGGRDGSRSISGVRSWRGGGHWAGASGSARK